MYTRISEEQMYRKSSQWRSTAFSITDAFEECDQSCFQDLSFSYLQEEERFWEQGSNVIGNLTQSRLANASSSFEKA